MTRARIAIGAAAIGILALVAIATDEDPPASGSEPRHLQVEIQATIQDDGQERPATGAWVHVDRETETFPPSDTPFLRIVTDADGRAVLTLPAGTEEDPSDWQIAVGREDLAPAVESWSEGDEDLAISLEPGSAVCCRIVDTAGRPVPTAEVFLDATPAIPLAQSDAKGWVRLRLESSPSLLVCGPGLATAALWDGDLIEQQCIVLRPGLSLAGVVVDRKGQPVAGASVVLSQDHFSARTLTMGDGRFEFEGLSRDRWPYREEADLEVERDGFLPIELESIPGDQELRVTLDRPGSISGHLVLADGTPVTEHGIHAEHARRGERVESELDATGAFRLDGVRPGPVLLRVIWGRDHPSCHGVYQRTHAVERLVHLSPDAPLEDVTLVLRQVPSSFLVADFVEHDGSRLRHPLSMGMGGIVTWSYFGAYAGLHSLQCPAKTRIEASYAVIERYRNKHRDQMERCVVGRIYRTFHTTASPNDPPIVVRLPRPSRLTLRIRDAEGQRLEKPAVVTVHHDGHDLEIHGEDLGRGDHAFEVRPGARIVVEVRSAGRGPVWRLLDKAIDAEELEIRLRPAARIRGRLVAPAVTPPFEIVMRDEDDQWKGRADLGPDGRFEVTGVPTGRLFIAIEQNFEERLVRVLEVEPGDVVDLGTIRAGGIPEPTGRVTDVAGRPLAALVTLLAPQGKEWLATAATDPEGRFDLPYAVIPDGTLEVRARGHGRAFFPATGSLAKPLEVRLRPEGKLRVTFDPDLPWTEWTQFTATLADGSASWDPPVEDAVDPEGRPCFVLRELPEGALRIECVTLDRSKLGVTGEIEVRVVAGETLDETMVIRPRR